MAYTGLHDVIAQRQDILLGELLEAGRENLEARQHGFTPLMMAVGAHLLHEDRAPPVRKRGDRVVANMLRLLLGAGADVRSVVADWPWAGYTALHMCCECYPGNASMLVDAGADVNAVSAEGQTPLMCAAPHAFLVKRLLRAGADASAVNMQGRNALFFAVTAAGVRLLLAAGAAAGQRDATGVSVARHLQALGRVEAAALVAASQEMAASRRRQAETPGLEDGGAGSP